MMKFLFKQLLLANYSFAKRWVNKKMPEKAIPGAIYTFLTSFSFMAAGIYYAIIGTISFKFKTFTPIFIGMSVVVFGIGYGFIRAY